MPAPTSVVVASSEHAQQTLTAMRGRFTRPIHTTEDLDHPSPPTMAPIVEPGVAHSFEVLSPEHLRPLFDPAVARSLRPAAVELARRANGSSTVTDVTSRRSLSFSLVGAKDVGAEVADGIAVYPGALEGGGDLVHRPRPDGTEDYLVFPAHPAKERALWSVDVREFAGLRLVGNTVEFLSREGRPVLRVAPPYVVDAAHARHEATLSIEGCAFEEDPRPKRAEAIVAPDAASCSVVVDWSPEHLLDAKGATLEYPVIVDPFWSTTGAMKAARRGFTATYMSLYLTEAVVAVGGNDGTNVLSSAEYWDAAGGAGSWTTLPSMPVARDWHTATLLSTNNPQDLFIAGGRTNVATNTVTNTAHQLSWTAGTWSTKTSMGNARAFHTANRLFGPTGVVFLVGGLGSSSTSEWFDPGTNSWLARAAVPTPRRQHTSSFLAGFGGQVLIAGGIEAGGAISNAARYNPGDNTWPIINIPMRAARFRHSATALSDGMIFISGGSSGSTALASTEYYNPTANAFYDLAPMAAARELHTLTTMSNDRVVAIGGGQFGATFSSTGELWDRPTNTWLPLGGMISGARGDHTTTSLGGDRALVAGGGASSGTAMTHAEIFSLLLDGETTADARTCRSTFASDGKCCNTACTGACDTCTTGTCTLTPGAASCGAAYLCVAGNASCPTSCTSDANCTATYYCNAASQCVPRKAQGAACNLAAAADCRTAGCRACTTNNCVDGVCCNTACPGTCNACAAAITGGVNGTCTAIPAGSDPQNECNDLGVGACSTNGSCNGAGACATYPAGSVCLAASCSGTILTKARTCSGTCMSNGTQDCSPYLCTGGACPTSCTTDANCIAGGYCDPVAKTCKLDQDPGLACTSATQCKSGVCVDGVCCATACDGLCMACSNAKTGAPNGTCSDIRDGTDPDNECATDPQSGCQRDGMCSSGKCRLYGPTTSCGTGAVCTGTTATGQFCDGFGVCKPAGAPVACKTGYACKPGVGCLSTCTTDTDCTGAYRCDAGACVGKNPDGTACTTGSTCNSGFCADGVCCDRACTGQCEACDNAVAKGTCLPVTGAPHAPRAACAAATGGDPCTEETCDGVDRTKCAAKVGSSVVCQAPSCTDGATLSSGKCGDGKCNVVTDRCEPFACVSASCATSCSSDTDCAPKFRCDTDRRDCVPRDAATCSADGLSVRDPAGAEKSCAPYVCAGGACKGSCGATADCAPGNICDVASGRCSAAPAAEDDAGCGCELPGGSRSGGRALFVGIGLVFALGLRRRRARTSLR